MAAAGEKLTSGCVLKKEEKVPTRTCLGCRQKRPKSLLLRFALDSGQLLLDRESLLGGRGVYCCNNDSCLTRFGRNRKQLARAFRVQQDAVHGKLPAIFGSKE